MTDKQLKGFIATDYCNILKDGENSVKYWFKKLWYNIRGYQKELNM